MTKPRYYTLIGSRSTPPHVLKVMEEFATDASKAGFIGRSGGADGADTTLEAAGLGRFEVFLPWKNFNGRPDSSVDGRYVVYTEQPNQFSASEIASRFLPEWEWLSQGAKKLHSRNVYQVLGRDLKTPSEFVVFYAEPSGKPNEVKGGTNTAVQVAIDAGIPVYNIFFTEVRDKIKGLTE